MFKKGFTITEVLIALGIVGIVSAAAIPQLHNNVLKTNAGTVLGKTVQQIETSCANMLRIDSEQNGDYNELLGLMNNPSFEIDNLSTYFSATISDNNNAVTTYSGDNYAGLNNSSRFDFSKYPASFSIEILELNDNNTNNANANIANIYIDINGFDNAPNNLGRDIFYFHLTNGGRMIPHGIETFNVLTQNNPDRCWNNVVGTGEGCAARVVADGFKINY